MAVCICHCDADGYASAAVVARHEPDIYFIVTNYGWELKKEKLKKGEKVYVVDFSYDLETMKYLRDNYDLIWIDHHDTSLPIAEQLGPVKGILDTSKAGCELTWEYLNPGVKPPRVITLVGRYDVWDHDACPGILQFDRGLSVLDPFIIGDGKLELWKRLFTDEDFVDSIISDGGEVWRKEKESYARLCRFLAFDADFLGHKVIAVNHNIKDMYFFESVFDPAVHEAAIGFYYHGPRDYWKVSVRGNPVSSIHWGEFCKRHFGGGGHAAAAAFTTKSFADIKLLRLNAGIK